MTRVKVSSRPKLKLSRTQVDRLEYTARRQSKVAMTLNRVAADSREMRTHRHTETQPCNTIIHCGSRKKTSATFTAVTYQWLSGVNNYSQKCCTDVNGSSGAVSSDLM